MFIFIKWKSFECGESMK